MAKKLQIEAIFRAVDRMSAPISRMQNRIQKFSRSAKRSMARVNRAATKVGKVLKKAVVAAIKAATVALTGLGVAIANVVKTGADFERTLAIAATKFPGDVRRGTKAYADLERAAKEAGKTTEFTASQSAEGLKLLGAAGLDVGQAIAVLPDVINLATVAEVELADASDMAVKTLGAMGLASKDAAQNATNLRRVMDVMNNTANSAAQSLTDVYEAFINAAPTATEFHQEIETVGASVIALARAGFVGEKATIAYRNMFDRLTNLTPKARKEIKRLGVELLDSKKNLRDPIALVGDLSAALDGLGTGERARRLSIIFGSRAKGPFVKLMEAGTKSLREFEASNIEATGSLTRSASQIQDTTVGSMKQLGSAIEGVKISLFALKDRAIKGVIDRMAEWIRKNEDLIVSKVSEFLEKIINNFDEIIRVLKIVGSVAGSLFLLVGAIKAVNAAMAAFDAIVALANPKVLLIVAIIAALGVAAYYVVKNWETVKQFFIDLWSGIKDVFASVIDYLVFTGPLSWFLFSVSLIKEYWGPLADFIGWVWQEISGRIESVVERLLGTGPVGLFISAAKTVIGAWSPVKDGIASIWDSIVGIFKEAVEKIKWLISPITNILDKFFSFKKELIRKHILGKTPEMEFKAAVSHKMNFETNVIPVNFTPREAESIEQPIDASIRQNVVGPYERVNTYFREENKTTTNQTEITIKDETGRAKVTRGKIGSGMKLERTGSF